MIFLGGATLALDSHSLVAMAPCPIPVWRGTGAAFHWDTHRDPLGQNPEPTMRHSGRPCRTMVTWSCEAVGTAW